MRWLWLAVPIFLLAFFGTCANRAHADQERLAIVTSEGRLVLDVDPAFAAGYYSVMEQEHGGQCQDDHTVLIAGKPYHTLGAMQILWDGSTEPLARSLGLTYEDVANTCWGNLTLASAMFDQTRRWSARWPNTTPKYELGGGDDGSGY